MLGNKVPPDGKNTSRIRLAQRREPDEDRRRDKLDRFEAGPDLDGIQTGSRDESRGHI